MRNSITEPAHLAAVHWRILVIDLRREWLHFNRGWKALSCSVLTNRLVAAGATMYLVRRCLSDEVKMAVFDRRRSSLSQTSFVARTFVKNGRRSLRSLWEGGRSVRVLRDPSDTDGLYKQELYVQVYNNWHISKMTLYVAFPCRTLTLGELVSRCCNWRELSSLCWNAVTLYHQWDQ